MQTPQFLYKILPMRNWYATQNTKTFRMLSEDEAFIHLATEEQIDKIAAKFFANVPEYVVVKLDPTKFKGELKFETNPGGVTKYYHLYNGFIPFDAILEVVIVYKEHPKTTCCALNVVNAGDPVLRQKARELTKEEILSPKIHALIEKMKDTMHAAPGVGLAAPQIGESLQIVVIEDADHSHITPERVKETERSIVPYHVVINPKITILEFETAEFYEGCLSVPALIGIVPRAKAVRVECLNEKAEPVVINARGWYARILQHEIDHLNGTLFIDRAIIQTLTTYENYDKLWKNKTIKETISELTVTTTGLRVCLESPIG